MKEGRTQVILNHWYYQADSRFTANGGEVSQPKYHKMDINPYIEYGLTDAITLGANLSVQRVAQSNATGLRQARGAPGDSEFFARFRLWQHDGWIISTEPMIKLPSPGSSTNQPVIGSDDPDVGLGLSVGYGFSAFGRQHYANIDASYRYRFGLPQNQLRYALTTGLSVADKWELMPQVFVTNRTNDPTTVSFTQSSADDYNLTKLQISAVYHYTDDVAFQFGAFSHIDGKNAGAGEGALFAIWTEF